MMDSPENSGSWAARRGAWLAVVLVVGVGMYLLGRHGFSARHPAIPATAATGDPAPAKPGERHLAPHDTFYLLQYVSAKKPDGVIGFEPGQEVHLVAVHRDTQTLVVGDDAAQVEVTPDKLTNDMDLAALVKRKDEDNQAKVAAYVASEKKAYEDSKRYAAVKTEQALSKIDEQKQQQQATLAAADAKAANDVQTGKDTQASPREGGSGNPLEQPPVEVGGTGYGYGNVGSAYYGSPYSYLGTTGTVTTAPVATGAASGAAGHATGGGAGRR